MAAKLEGVIQFLNQMAAQELGQRQYCRHQWGVIGRVTVEGKLWQLIKRCAVCGKEKTIGKKESQ